MPLRFQQAVHTMDIWSANSADISFVISFSSPNGAGLRGRHGFLASWRPLYSGTGAVKVTGSPFETFVEAEAACNMMLVVLNESRKPGNRSQANNRSHHVLVAMPDQINQKHNKDGELHGEAEIAEDFPANFVAALSGQYPLVRAAGLSQSKSGRTSAPRLPQAADVKRGSISESLTSSGHVLALIATKWLNLRSLR
jgi:hypothetical protein